MNTNITRIAVIFSHFRHFLGEGGVERMRWNLIPEFVRRGISVDIVGLRPEGFERIPKINGVNVIKVRSYNSFISRYYALKYAKSWWRELLRPILLPIRIDPCMQRLPGLISYLRSNNPDLLIVGKPQENLTTMIAKSAVSTKTQIVLSQHGILSHEFSMKRRQKTWRWRYVSPLLRNAYMEAKAIVAVSNGVAKDLKSTLNLPSDKIKVVYNPIIDKDFFARMNESIEHPWLTNRTNPVLLNVARMDQMKDQQTLLKAFALARERREIYLILLGSGREFAQLQDTANKLNISRYVDMPGYKNNPLPYMVHADALVHTSRHEGFGNVLVEALGCGCPVISTDCYSGPAEILENGLYGKLVPVGDHEAVCKAILETLDSPPHKEKLRSRACEFSSQKTADEYLNIYSNM